MFPSRPVKLRACSQREGRGNSTRSRCKRTGRIPVPVLEFDHPNLLGGAVEGFGVGVYIYSMHVGCGVMADISCDCEASTWAGWEHLRCQWLVWLR